jgi:hypothetical protein
MVWGSIPWYVNKTISTGPSNYIMLSQNEKLQQIQKLDRLIWRSLLEVITCHDVATSEVNGLRRKSAPIILDCVLQLIHRVDGNLEGRTILQKENQ